MTCRNALPSALVALLVAAWPVPRLGAQGIDPAKIVTAEACGECHVSAFAVWEETRHATGFRTLHRKQSAAQIAERMGEKLIKRDSVCLDCHYTPHLDDGDLRAASGVSCESCHGAGRDWIDIHNDYGGKDVDHKSESAEHRARRIERSVAAGMRRLSDLYSVVASCYGCHTVPNEKLVNVGRHSLGSAGFEVTEWSKKIRHNFLDSFLGGDGTKNAVRSPEHDRRLYVTGRALDVEYSLRGLAEASENGVYAKAMQRRLRSAVVELRAIGQVTGLPEVDAMVTAVRAAPTGPEDTTLLLAAADKVGAEARRFLEGHDGSRLAALDPLLVDGAAAVTLEEPEETALADAGPAGQGATTAAATGTSGTSEDAEGSSGGTNAATTRVVSEAVPAEGEKRSHLRPRSDHDTLAATACQKCHGDQNAWWFDDRHFSSIEPFLERAPKNVKIARLYGLSAAEMGRGTSLCMDCHGTFATGREKRQVQDGVSCQSCHGPGADFLEPHQEGEKSLGRRRPGFQKALQLGMRDLGDLETRLRNCASCHYVTDPRLISSGHPAGADFDIVESMQKIKHWQHANADPASTRQAWAALLGERGPVPKVRLARLARTETVAGAVAPGGDPGGRQTRVYPQRPAANAPGAASGASASEGSSTGASQALAGAFGRRVPEGQLPPLPDIGPETPIGETLRLLKAQLEALYRSVRGDGEDSP